MQSLYKPHDRFSAPVQMGRCQASVPVGGRSARFHQCCRKGVIDRDGVLYCKQHDPVAVQEREREADERYRKEQAARTTYFHRQRMGQEALRALELIADGHNNPRALAQEIITKLADA